MWLILPRERAPNCGIKGKAAYHVTALNTIRQWQSNKAEGKLSPILDMTSRRLSRKIMVPI